MCIRQLFIFPVCLLVLSCCAQEDDAPQEPDVQRYHYQTGTKKITVRKTTYSSSPSLFFLQLHDDENTVEQAATAFLQQHGGTLLSIENTDSRYLQFSLNKKRYMFDPNRMFTATGIRENLALFGSRTTAAEKVVTGFRHFLLGFIPDSVAVIAVHNNTDGRYSITSYKNGNALQRDAAAVHINNVQDSDDFFITTDYGVFKKLAAADYNCVLQNNKAARDDGSLSFYYGRRNRTYINVEAQTGHLTEQLQMLQALKKILE